MKQIIADTFLDFATLMVFGLLIYTKTLTAGEGLPPLLLIMGVKTANQIKGGPRAGGVATIIAFLAAGGAMTADETPGEVAAVDRSGEHRPAE